MHDRIDWLYAQQPTPSVEVYLDLIGKELFELCQNFPQSIEEFGFANEQNQRRYINSFSAMRRPDTQQLDVLAQLLTWELQREFEAIDDFMRNERYLPTFSSSADIEAMHLLHQLLLDKLLERQQTSSFGTRRVDMLRSITSFKQCIRASASGLILI